MVYISTTDIYWYTRLSTAAYDPTTSSSMRVYLDKYYENGMKYIGSLASQNTVFIT